MYKHLFFLLLISLFAFACNEDGMMSPDPDPSELTEYELEVIDYFKEITLGFEFGGASEITRKWKTDMKIFVGGSPTDELLNELEEIKASINDLATDGFSMEVVSDSMQSNFYIFLGTGEEYAKINPSQSDQVDSNWGLFNVFWNGSNEINRGRMYVDIERADPTEQQHLLREELTQSLGLAKDSAEYPESIFQSSWTRTTEYAMIDEDVIRLLYHPDLPIGLDAMQVEVTLRDILMME